jgi:ketosteroid isomerase-like protein
MKQKCVPLGTALVATLLLLVHSLGAQTPTSRDEEPAARAFLAEFISAFENLEWHKFRNSFTDDATVFIREAPRTGPTVARNMKHAFTWSLNRSVREELPGPYLDAAIVTFQLDDRPGFVNRRTLVLRKAGGVWKIAHLHASELRVSPQDGKN